ncbi:Tlg2-vesicle protein [Ascosphaera acerosa]|nr:Tlg2-vesicle protein [Ascosphaera acerosa]
MAGHHGVRPIRTTFTAPPNIHNDDAYHDDDDGDSPIGSPGETYLERPLLEQHGVRDETIPAAADPRRGSRSQSRSRPRRRASASSSSISFSPASDTSNTSAAFFDDGNSDGDDDYDDYDGGRPLARGPAQPWPRRLRALYETYADKAVATWAAMPVWQRVLAVGVVGGCAAGGIGLVVMSKRLMEWIVPKAHDWEQTWQAYVVLWLMTFTVSFPPLIGWATIGTFAGFILGVWKGWLVYATGTVIGSTTAVYASRTVLRGLVRRLLAHDRRFAALSLTLKYDGLKLLCMIRLCPLPYSACNGAMATFDTVHPLMYGLATLLVSPKLLITIFIGSRLRVLLEEGEEMSAAAKAVNGVSILVTIAIGVGTAMYIYRSTLARAKELQRAERASRRNRRRGSSRRPSTLTSTADSPVLPAPGSFVDSPVKAAFDRDEERDIGLQHGRGAGAAGEPDEDLGTFTDHEDDVFDLADGFEDDDDAEAGGTGTGHPVAARRESIRLHRSRQSVSK